MFAGFSVVATKSTCLFFLWDVRSFNYILVYANSMLAALVTVHSSSIVSQILTHYPSLNTRNTLRHLDNTVEVGNTRTPQTNASLQFRGIASSVDSNTTRGALPVSPASCYETTAAYRCIAGA